MPILFFHVLMLCMGLCAAETVKCQNASRWRIKTAPRLDVTYAFWAVIIAAILSRVAFDSYNEQSRLLNIIFIVFD